jgi:hypothetical protein
MLWIKIEGFDYSINELGQVKNNQTGKILKASVDGCGYLKVDLYANGKKKTHTIHRLLGVYFLHCPSNKEVDHWDGDRKNNSLQNLRVVTHQQNMWNKTSAKGYYWNVFAEQWAARIRLNGKQIHIGCYDTEVEARAAYLEEKKNLHIMPVKELLILPQGTEVEK